MSLHSPEHHHPVAQIGSREHSLCSLSDTPGIVRGVTSATPGNKSTAVEAVEGHDHLAQGVTLRFDEEADIEILEFDADNVRSRGISNPYIRPIRMTLRPGASLTGPIAWRMAPEKGEKEDPSGAFAHSPTADIVVTALLVLIFVSLASASIGVALALFGILCLTAFFVWIKHSIRMSRFKRIAKFGSGYVLAPEKKFWV